jgi:hypothetical protein
MPGIVEFPTLVQEARDQFGDLFENECQRRHCAEDLTRLIVAERKTVLGIQDEFAQTTDQSCRNRSLTQAPWEFQALNQRRLERLQEAQVGPCEGVGIPSVRTIGKAGRAMVKETLRKMLSWPIDQVTERGLPFERVVAQLRIL